MCAYPAFALMFIVLGTSASGDEQFEFSHSAILSMGRMMLTHLDGIANKSINHQCWKDWVDRAISTCRIDHNIKDAKDIKASIDVVCVVVVGMHCVALA